MSKRNTMIIASILILLTLTYNLSYRILITELIASDDLTLTLREYDDKGIKVEIEDKDTLLKKMKNGIVCPILFKKWHSSGKYFLKIEVSRDGEKIGNISSAYELVSVIHGDKIKNYGMYFNYDLHTYIQNLYIEELSERSVNLH